MRSRVDMLKELGIGRLAVVAGTSLAMYAAMAITVLVINQPAGTAQALMDFVTPVAQASSPPSDQPAPQALPTSAQAKTWDPVEYGEHDFDSPSGQNQD